MFKVGDAVRLTQRPPSLSVFTIDNPTTVGDVGVVVPDVPPKVKFQAMARVYFWRTGTTHLCFEHHLEKADV